jgi:hypothetical protein
MRIHFDVGLRDLFPPVIEVVANTVLEGLELICNQHPLANKIAKVNVKVKDFPSHLALSTPTDWPDIYIELEDGGYSGAGGSFNKPGRMQIALSIVMVAASFFLPGIGQALAVSLRLSAATMAIGGVIALLAPQPEIADDTERKSRYFGGDKTTTKIGTPIQMVFGRRLVYPQLISFDVDALPYNGIENPLGSPYFKEKADSSIAEANINRFYGAINAGVTEKIQVTQVYRTGSQF